MSGKRATARRTIHAFLACSLVPAVAMGGMPMRICHCAPGNCQCPSPSATNDSPSGGNPNSCCCRHRHCAHCGRHGDHLHAKVARVHRAGCASVPTGRDGCRCVFKADLSATKDLMRVHLSSKELLAASADSIDVTILRSFERLHRTDVPDDSGGALRDRVIALRCLVI